MRKNMDIYAVAAQVAAQKNLRLASEILLDSKKFTVQSAEDGHILGRHLSFSEAKALVSSQDELTMWEEK